MDNEVKNASLDDFPALKRILNGTDKRRSNVICSYVKNLRDLEKNLDKCVEKSKNIHEDFGEPSLYFHSKAIEAAKSDFLSERHIEMIYALLPAWGMHRMGKTNTKIIAWKQFYDEIIKEKVRLEKYRKSVISNNDDFINEIVDLLFDIKVSISKSTLVSSSKVLHHILPNLISPIDRKYSIRFMGANPSNELGKEKNEKELAKIFICGMYDFLIKNEKKLTEYKKNINNEFNTSLTKLFDNLVVSYMKLKGGSK
ncbi:MAG: hypothetical protein FWF51_08595 [Chitinivibrionia bacterium]|nr:hypothetical protein [Chitinivibrionia bacterium]